MSLETNKNIMFQKYKRFRNKYVFNETDPVEKTIPAASAVIFVSSNEILRSVLGDMKDSVWWNHRARFLIVNKNPENSCGMAEVLLNTLWNFNILSAIYLCQNYNNTFGFYTFNPYTNSAPLFWKKMRVFTQSIEPLTLFEHPFEQPKNGSESLLCKNLYYDKAKNLKGFNVKAVVHQSANIISYYLNRSGYDRCMIEPTVIIGCTLLKHVNGNLTVKVRDTFSFIDVHADGRPQGSLEGVSSSSADILFYPSFIRGYWHQETYPFFTLRIKVISLKDFMTSTDVIGFTSTQRDWFYFIIGCFTFIVSLKYLLRLSMSTATLEFVRLVAGTAHVKQPKNVVRRMMLFILISHILVFSSFVQSFLTSTQTVVNRRPMIDTPEDLIKSKLNIYGMPSHKELIPQEDIRNRHRSYRHHGECAKRLSRGERVACEHVEVYLKEFYAESEYTHISKGNLIERGVGFTTAEDFPLVSKFNYILSRLKEGGFIKLFYKRLEDRLQRILDSVAVSDEATVLKGLGMKDSALIFCILVMSWFLGSFACFVEVVTHHTSNILRKKCSWPKYTSFKNFKVSRYFRFTKGRSSQVPVVRIQNIK